jgi:hypothetical protein
MQYGDEYAAEKAASRLQRHYALEAFSKHKLAGI